VSSSKQHLPSVQGAPTITEHVLQHASEQIPYTIVRSDRRTLALIVAADGSVRVRAPRRASESDIVRFVEGRAAWVAARRAAAAARQQAAPRYATGDVHPYLGRDLRLECAAGRLDGARLDGGILRVTTAGEPVPERVKKVIDEWYRAQALRYVTDRVAACWVVFARPGETLPDVRVRLMRSRWGSLTAANRMSLSAYLMRAPAECIDYVIFHELCHLRVRNHSAAFYREVERYVPEWRRLRVRLRDASVPRAGGPDTPMVLG